MPDSLPFTHAPSRMQEDGTVVVPEVLRPFMMGIEVIRPRQRLATAA